MSKTDSARPNEEQMNVLRMELPALINKCNLEIEELERLADFKRGLIKEYQAVLASINETSF